MLLGGGVPRLPQGPRGQTPPNAGCGKPGDAATSQQGDPAQEHLTRGDDSILRPSKASQVPGLGMQQRWDQMLSVVYPRQCRLYLDMDLCRAAAESKRGQHHPHGRPLPAPPSGRRVRPGAQRIFSAFCFCVLDLDQYRHSLAPPLKIKVQKGGRPGKGVRGHTQLGCLSSQCPSHGRALTRCPSGRAARDRGSAGGRPGGQRHSP